MKNIFFLLVLLSLNCFADAEALKQDFISSLPKYAIAPPAQQAFCYMSNGKVEGYQPQKLQRIASLTKILTTYYASELADLSGSFETKIFIAGDRMHIAGGNDPYFEEDKILLLMQALNNEGYKTFRSVTFDDKFIFTDLGSDTHFQITPALVKSRLATIWGAKSASYVRGLWLSVQKFAKEEGVSLDTSRVPTLLAKSVTFSQVNPLANLAPTVLVHRSLPFHRILKSMNVMSKNHVAENIFRQMSKIKSFDQFMVERGFSTSEFKVLNGSGLPIETGKRFDNIATCELIMKVSMNLHESIKRQNLELSDIMAVNGGKDLGSFRNRFLRYPETHQAVISKTGTLMHTSSLAGFLQTNELIPFAILNHTSNLANARLFQDHFVSRMFFHLGEPEPLVYDKISIFPWDESEFLATALDQNLALN